MNKTTPPPIIRKPSEQKLVSIYLDNVAYAKGKVLVGSFADKHGLVEEHLGPFLKEGWRVVKLHGLGRWIGVAGCAGLDCCFAGAMTVERN